MSQAMKWRQSAVWARPVWARRWNETFAVIFLFWVWTGVLSVNESSPCFWTDFPSFFGYFFCKRRGVFCRSIYANELRSFSAFWKVTFWTGISILLSLTSASIDRGYFFFFINSCSLLYRVCAHWYMFRTYVGGLRLFFVYTMYAFSRDKNTCKFLMCT